jgi:hypothetical protein
MSSVRFSARLDMFHHGPPRQFKDAQIVSNNLTRFVSVPTDKNAEDSSQVSVEAMLWVLLYLPIGHDTCYWEHLAQHGAQSCMHPIRALTKSFWQVMQEEISVLVACKLTWQNVRAYQSPARTWLCILFLCRLCGTSVTVDSSFFFIDTICFGLTGHHVYRLWWRNIFRLNRQSSWVQVVVMKEYISA